MTLLPPVKNSGAPHSSVSTCETSWQMTLWWLRQNWASASALAAVPLKTKKTSHSAARSSRMCCFARAVHVSSP
jgi:hypothetical protein